MIPNSTLCPVCGATSRRNCEINEMVGAAEGEIECMWEDIDPDILREDRDEQRRIEADLRRDLYQGLQPPAPAFAQKVANCRHGWAD